MSDGLIHLPGEKTEAAMRQYYRQSDWTAVLTSHSTKIVCKDSDRVLMSDTLLTLPALRCISVLHKSVRNNIKLLPTGLADPAYYRYKYARLGGGRLYEYDLNAAYLRAALALGLIDQTLHDKINVLKKEERLAVMGSLATQKVFIEYKEESVSNRYTTRCPLYPAWNALVSWVDAKMTDLYTGQEGSLFYWVDALFLERPADIPDSKQKVVYYKADDRFIKFDDGRKFPIIQPRGVLP